MHDENIIFISILYQKLSFTWILGDNRLNDKLIKKTFFKLKLLVNKLTPTSFKPINQDLKKSNKSPWAKIERFYGLINIRI